MTKQHLELQVSDAVYSNDRMPYVVKRIYDVISGTFENWEITKFSPEGCSLSEINYKISSKQGAEFQIRFRIISGKPFSCYVRGIRNMEFYSVTDLQNNETLEEIWNLTCELVEKNYRHQEVV